MSFLKLIRNFSRDIYENRFVLGQLVRRDYKNRYLGSFLGFLWTIIQPIVMIFVLWLVFTKGFKTGPINGTIPFIAYLSIGMIAWNFFVEVWSTSTSVFQEYSYLVKKINFKIAILPVVKLLSSFVTHLIFIAIGIIILIVSGVAFSWYWFQMFYYLLAMMVFVLGLSWISSSLQVFMRDISQIIGVILQFGFWLTPVVWNFDIVPKEWQLYFKLNPMFYIVDGYRKSFITSESLVTNPENALYFWVVTLIILLIGVVLFKKLRPHFADVL